MTKIIGYFHDNPRGNTWRVVDDKKYKKQFSHKLAVDYLEYKIKESVIREMDCILKNGQSAGFYAAVRFLFPEINHLAHLYWGYQNSSWIGKEKRLVPLFMKKFHIFADDPGAYYKVFRHGLMHSHHPKWIKRKGVIGWYVSNTAKIDQFGIFTPEMRDLLVQAIDKFISELNSEASIGHRNRLNKFSEAMIDCGKILRKKDLRLYRQKTKVSGSLFSQYQVPTPAYRQTGSSPAPTSIPFTDSSDTGV